MKPTNIIPLVLLALVSGTTALTGDNICTRRKRDYYTRLECVYNTWIGCCVWKTVTVCRYITEYYCCSGYSEVSNTCQPVCNDACQNGGTCIAPNTCQCSPGNSGATCGTVVCSHLRPCYPGSCTLPDTCVCSTGYTAPANNCSKITIAPELSAASAELAFFNSEKQMDVYNLSTDSTNPNTDIPDFFWTNLVKFNMWSVNMQAIFEPGDLPGNPSYIPEVQLGISSAGISYDLKDSTSRVKTSGSTTCTPAVSSLAPQTDILDCPVTFDTFDFRLDHGDVFTINFLVESGGYENLNVIGTSTYYGRITYTGTQKQKSVEFRFDYVTPVHCSEMTAPVSCSTAETALNITNVITKDPVEIHWSGWTDALAGMSRYALEIFRLVKQGDTLLEDPPLSPELITAFNDSSITEHNFTYTPQSSGMFSVILEAADNANNSRYIRRFFLYDPTSTIEIKTGTSATLRVASATFDSGYTWQSNQDNTATAISLNWAGHFINQIQTDGGFLNSIQDYPPQLQDTNVDTSFKKVIDTDIADTSVRTSASIENIDGIVEFQTYFERKLVGIDPVAPSTGWTVISPLATYYNFSENVNGGECLMLWVRAFDIMGNNATDSTVVCFDSTVPVIRTLTLAERNVPTTLYNAASRIEMTTLDPESGIFRVGYKFYDNSTGELMNEEGAPVSGNTTSKTEAQCLQDGDCYCITTGSCYTLAYAFDIDHCWLYKAGVDLSTLVVRMDVTSYNQGLLTTVSSLMITGIDTLDGMDYCARRGVTTVVTEARLSGGGIAAIVIAILLLLAFIIFVLFLHKTGRLQKVKQVTIERIASIRPGGNTGLAGYKQWQNGGYDEEDIYLYGTQTYEQTPDWYIKSSELAIGNIIKVGKFARIFEATLYNAGKKTTVVAKTLKENFTEQDSLLMSAKINFFGTTVGRHSCLLDFIGAVTDDPSTGPVMVLEYCEHGQMNKWLQSQKSSINDTIIENLYRFAYDIVRGMEFLASKKIIHMRLAARNILLTGRLEAKVAGFGPRQGDDEEEGGKKERIPVKWIAPECMNNSKSASEKSDVWSYGIVLWEIFTLGETPYPDVRSRDLPRYLKAGNRPSKPEYSDDTHYALMKKAWQKNPKSRPTFVEAREEIEHLFRQSSGDMYYYDS